MKIGDYLGYYKLWAEGFISEQSASTPLGIIVATAYVGDDPSSVKLFAVLQADGDIVIWTDSVLEVISESR